jgi:hypothetical protein
VNVSITLSVIVLALLGAAGAIAYGRFRWRKNTQAVRGKMQAACLPIRPATYDAREIAPLPPPVQRYFRAVLQDGQPIIGAARLLQQGQIRSRESSDTWQPFDATQFVNTQPPGFDWDAAVKMAPGVRVYVRDAYTAGAGTLHAAILGLVTVARMQSTPELAHGELMRFLAEAAWYPTALLPSQGVQWEPIDDASARATLADGAIRVSLDFHFERDGLITTVRAPSRHRTVDGALQTAPWQGRFWSYAERAGMRVPLDAEVEWELPNGPLPYWRGRVVDIEYESASPKR